MKVLFSMWKKVEKTMSIKQSKPSLVMDSLPNPNVDAALIDSMSSTSVRQVEVRLSEPLSQVMFEKMENGLFGDTITSMIREIGCICWTGPETNLNAKVRKRSNGEAVIKVTRSAFSIAPGHVLAMSDEYSFTGRIMYPQHDVDMIEIRTKTLVRNQIVNIIARRYMTGNRITYACEFEVTGRITNSILRSVLKLATCSIGIPSSMRNYIDSEYLMLVEKQDHIVVDIPDPEGYAGVFMAKADGVKVFVMCYSFGYIISNANPDMTTISCVVDVSHETLPELSMTPTIIVAEMMIDGSLVYIDTIGVMKNVEPAAVARMTATSITEKRPFMIYRTKWQSMPTDTQLELEPMPNDGVVIVNESMTMRLKQPTIDLMYLDQKLNTIDNGALISIADGHEKMIDRTLYEMDVIKVGEHDNVLLINPRQRVMKKIPNSMDLVERAIAATVKSANINSILLDVTAMSFAIWERVYMMAQTRAPANRKVIVIFSAGRFQEWKEMMHNNFSYIAIDPDVDVEILHKRIKKFKIRQYDFKQSFNTPVLSISKQTSTVIWAKCKSEEFLRLAMPTKTMSSLGIPAVFSFSISYHTSIINMLATDGISTFGCGFVHDNMDKIVGKEPVTMKIQNSSSMAMPCVMSKFGRSVWKEPILKMSSVGGLVKFESAMPGAWKRVNGNTIDIMSRAVIMSA